MSWKDIEYILWFTYSHEGVLFYCEVMLGIMLQQVVYWPHYESNAARPLAPLLQIRNQGSVVSRTLPNYMDEKLDIEEEERVMVMMMNYLIQLLILLCTTDARYDQEEMEMKADAV